jgi:hypothetical protein
MESFLSRLLKGKLSLWWDPGILYDNKTSKEKEAFFHINPFMGEKKKVLSELYTKKGLCFNFTH